MSVSNKTIRELESAAVEAVQAMNELNELLNSGGSAPPESPLGRMRLATIELDRAERACSRERCFTMSEEEMRSEFEVLGLDWDETTERGQALMQRLLAEYDAKRPAEIASARLLAGLDDVFEEAHDKIRAGASIEIPLKLTVLDIPPDTSKPMPFVRVDPQLLDLPLGHQPGGLGDGGKSDYERWYEQVKGMQRARLAVRDAGLPDWADGEGEPRLGVPVQVALGASPPMPGEDCRMVKIIGYSATEYGSFWVSDHGMLWAREVGTATAPTWGDTLTRADVEAGRWNMKQEVLDMLTKHFDGVGPLSIEAIVEANERGRRAREAQP